MSNTVLRRKRIKLRIRKSVNGTSDRPRLNVFRSNKEIYAQLINDDTKLTILSTSSVKLNKEGKTKTEIAKEVGQVVAQLANQAGINSVVFDRNGYLYHGRVKALADGARENGLIF
ncbi:MAG: 50S ribosomal protein L18 [Chitinophagales bacterium]|nr:50S ribosomal protein L18 [Chitinophagales bacterium]MCZ2392538.1 50S ribosomal protein L18 [Chitinophagales bacterium]